MTLDPARFIAETASAATRATMPEQALEIVMRACHGALGDREAHRKAGALDAGLVQFFVAGAFLITPDRAYQMLIGNTGFPAEQKRLMVPIDGGHPGWVVANRRPLLLSNTDEDRGFRQYLKTARMGSAAYAPLLWQDEVLGLIIVAAQARHTLGPADLAILEALAPMAAALWIALDGPAWLAGAYPPADAWRAPAEGLK
jgi:GAF domain-containing protein